jgi:hypothetical protein
LRSLSCETLDSVATITQVRGALLEEAVLFLLRKVGYDTYDSAALTRSQLQHMRAGNSGLEVRGRGTWHQLDAFALWKHSPAFMYPLHLMVEAKCYAAHRPVGVEVARNSVGVLKDISENYFTYTRRGESFRGPRYNHTAAIFSTSGFTQGAVEYAVAHQVFLIQYENVPAIQPLIDAIFEFGEDCVNVGGQQAIAAARGYYRRCLVGAADDRHVPRQLTERGRRLLRGSVTETARDIEGSYFGMLQGQWPLHLLRKDPLPPQAFASDVVQCRVHGNIRGEWRFVPNHFHPSQAGWFELEFSLPPVIAELVEEHWEDPVAVANLKQQHFSFIDLTGVIDGIRRSVRLELDRQWIQEYIRRRQ